MSSSRTRSAEHAEHVGHFDIERDCDVLGMHATGGQHQDLAIDGIERGAGRM